MRKGGVSRRRPSLSLGLGVGLALTMGGACKRDQPPDQRFYPQHIQPIFNNFCVGNTSPCHRIDPVGGTALGNLDLSSFAGVQKRRDVLRTYGSYPQPLLLLKALPEETTLIPYRGRLLPSEIRHDGGKGIAPNSDAYYELKRWLDNGATLDGLPPEGRSRRGQGDCNTALPPEVDLSRVDTGSAVYQRYVSDVEPVLHASCAFGTCHSSPQSDFYLTCGSNEQQLKFNFAQVAGFITTAPTAVEQSEVLLRPLSPQAGGVSHTGGVFFQSREDAGWRKLRAWGELVQGSPSPETPASAGQKFFAENVMPIMLQRGCAFEGCHSPNGFNDFRLRPGAQGFFAPLALRRNYEATLFEFMALDTPDVRQSRAVKKAIFTSLGGLIHRGGPVLETMGRDSSVPCPSPYVPPPDPPDPTKPSPTAFCTLGEWHRIERQDRAADVSPLAIGDLVPLAFVSRPPDPDGPLEFDTFRGGADLKLADAAIGARGRLESVGDLRSALGPCAGLAGKPDLDVRGPEWSYDGRKLAFAVRVGAGSGLDLWLLDFSGGGPGSCRQLTSDNGRMQGPVRVHNFDPAFAPDGSLVFASTRSGTLTLKRLLPNADLFRVGPGLDFSAPEQMTWLLNSELSPAFMQDGRMTFTAEKASAEFYQLSGRRMNWDLTDYHPLLAQRAQSDDTFGSMRASVGFQQATEIREGLDRNFLVIVADATARGGGGALATFNRSLGPFEQGRNEVTFLRAMAILDPGATGRAGTAGVYRSPFSLPDGEVLASYAGEVKDPAQDTPRYDLVAVTEGGTRRMLVSGGAASLVEAALGYKRAERLQFKNLPQLVFGGHGGSIDDSLNRDRAVMHFPDLPMLATLLGANLRRGRNVAGMDRAAALRVWQENAPATSPADGSKLLGSQMVYTDRTMLGSAALEADKSVKAQLPAQKPLILELVDAKGGSVLAMSEEHQLGPGEYISPGVPRKLFNGVCGGCHGSVSGQETEVAVTPDALTGASVSMSREAGVKVLK